MFICNCCKQWDRPGKPKTCNIPLQSVSFSSIIQNSLVNLSVTQGFQNQEKKPVEVQYTFSLSDDSVITCLRIHLQDGTILVAKVRDSEKAAEIYQDSIAAGNTAVLGTVDDNKKMSISIGNLAPGDSVKVEFFLTFPMSTDESSWKLIIPKGFLPADAEAQGIECLFLVQIIASKRIKTYSSNVNMNWNLSPDGLKLLGESEERTLERYSEKDFWVKYNAEDSNKPTLLYQKYEDKFMALVSFIPFNDSIAKLEEAEGMGEFIFVLDRSGSMSGNRIEMAKKATVLFLKSLPSNSYFNIVSFGNSTQKMFDRSEVNSSVTVDQAVQNINSFGADLGGTNIYDPLTQIFNQGLIQGYSRTIFLITDGQVENSNLVIELIEHNSDKSRVHSFGVGSDFDKLLIINSAKAGKGSWNFIEKTEEIGEKVISALIKSITPSVNQWEISLQGEHYPTTSKIGNIHYGERFIQYYLLDKIPNDGITLKYFDNFEKGIVETPIGCLDFIEGEQIFKLWAKMKIEHLSKDRKSNENEIKKLSICAGIPCALTSFICVKENENPVLDEFVSRIIKIREVSESEPFPSNGRIHQGFYNFLMGPSVKSVKKNYSSGLSSSCSATQHPYPLPQQDISNSLQRVKATVNSCRPPPPPNLGGPPLLGYPTLPGCPPPPGSQPLYSCLPPPPPPPNLGGPPLLGCPTLPGCPLPPGSRLNSFGPPPLANPPERASRVLDILPSPSSPPLLTDPHKLGGPPSNGDLAQSISVPKLIQSPLLDFQPSIIDLPTLNSAPMLFDMHEDLICLETKYSEKKDNLTIIEDHKKGLSPQINTFSFRKIDYMSLISMQKSEGFWSFKEVSNYQSEFTNISVVFSDLSLLEDAQSTIIVLCILEKFFSEKRGEWTLVHRKAVNWLRSQSVDYSSLSPKILNILT